MIQHVNNMASICLLRILPQTISFKFLNQGVNSQRLWASTDTQANYLLFYDNVDEVKRKITCDIQVFQDFVTYEEEQSLFNEVEPYLRRMKYESSHWDDAIHGYRETEKLKWNSANSVILDRVKELAFPQGTRPLKFVHVLDLQEEGVIKPHIDSIKFCGTTIAGISLLSDCVMRLRHNQHTQDCVDVLLSRCSLYLMKGVARYDYTHEILAKQESRFGNKPVQKSRRISIICRNEPH